VEVTAALGVALLGVTAALLAMWATGWFHDEHGRPDVRGEQLALLVVPAALGAFTGMFYGPVAGSAVLLAAGGVLYGLVLGWGLAGGDGQAANIVSGLCGVGLMLAAAGAAVLAFRHGAWAGPSELALIASPAPVAVAGLAAARGPGRARLKVAAVSVLVYGVPPALLAVG
jgi:hypothetical protein